MIRRIGEQTLDEKVNHFYSKAGSILASLSRLDIKPDDPIMDQIKRFYETIQKSVEAIKEHGYTEAFEYFQQVWVDIIALCFYNELYSKEEVGELTQKCLAACNLPSPDMITEQVYANKLDVRNINTIEAKYRKIIGEEVPKDDNPVLFVETQFGDDVIIWAYTSEKVLNCCLRDYYCKNFSSITRRSVGPEVLNRVEERAKDSLEKWKEEGGTNVEAFNLLHYTISE